MNVELPNMEVPEQAEVEIQFSLKAKVNVTAQTAQRQVSKLLLDQVGNLLYGEQPDLVAGDKLLWRVPVWLASPQTGPLGEVGKLDVDAQTGELLYTKQMLEDLKERAYVLAERTSPETG